LKIGGVDNIYYRRETHCGKPAPEAKIMEHVWELKELLA
jgi:hypothetical protein